MAAIKVNVKGVEEARISIMKKFEIVKKNKQMLNQIGETAADRMKFQARRGKPLQGRKVGEFPAGYPKASTVAGRKEIAKHNKTHEAYAPTRANLTITGQLIEAISFKILKAGLIRFFVAGPRVPYMGASGKPGKAIGNSKVYKHLLDKNKKFGIIGIDEKSEKRTNNIIRQFLRRALKF